MDLITVERSIFAHLQIMLFLTIIVNQTPLKSSRFYASEEFKTSTSCETARVCFKRKRQPKPNNSSETAPQKRMEDRIIRRSTKRTNNLTLEVVTIEISVGGNNIIENLPDSQQHPHRYFRPPKILPRKVRPSVITMIRMVYAT